MLVLQYFIVHFISHYTLLQYLRSRIRVKQLTFEKKEDEKHPIDLIRNMTIHFLMNRVGKKTVIIFYECVKHAKASGAILGPLIFFFIRIYFELRASKKYFYNFTPYKGPL